MTLRRECSWCKAAGRPCELPPQPGDEDEPDRVSHGICPSCADTVAAEPVRIIIQAGRWIHAGLAPEKDCKS